MSSPAAAAAASPQVARALYNAISLDHVVFDNHRVPHLQLYRHVPCEFLDEKTRAADPAAPPPVHGLHSGSWPEYHSWVDAQAAAHATRGTGVRIKTLYLLRHAEGTHNVAEAKFGTEHWDAVESLKEEYEDPDLTPAGVQQCQNFAAGLPAALQNGLSPQLVLVSPFLRTLRTAELCLGELPPSLAPWVVCEQARETLGEHTCDRRRHITPEIESQFSRMQFHLLRDRGDVLWTPARETEREIMIRTARLLDFLFELPEERILIVAHSGIINMIARIIGQPLTEQELQGEAARQAASAGISRPPSPHTLDDFEAMHQTDGTLKAPVTKSKHCELLTYCVAQMPPRRRSLSKL